MPRWRSASDRMVRIAMQFGMGIWKIEFLARVLYRESGVCVAAKLERSDYGMMHEELDTHHK